MRSNHWEYLALVLLALGIAFILSGAIIYVSYQQIPQRKIQYNGVQIPLITVGTCFVVLGVFVFLKSNAKKKVEVAENVLLPPPPPPPPS